MPKIRFTQNIQRHTECPEATLLGTDVRSVLNRYFEQHPQARSYVLDDQGKLRKHMAIFIDGSHVKNREALNDPVSPDSIIDVIQALSGG